MVTFTPITALSKIGAILIASLSLIAQAQDLNFSTSNLEGISIRNPTTLDFGPDGRLYVAQQEGQIYAYTIAQNAGTYTAVETEIILDVFDIPNHNDDGTLSSEVRRQVTGILAMGTVTNPVLYVSSSDPRIGGGSSRGDVNVDTNSGIISRLTWDGTSWDKVDLVRGLPRSEENHANNGIVFNAFDNELLVAVGGLTNAGSPSNNFAFISEYAYSAAIVRVDLDALESMPIQEPNSEHPYVYDLPTLDDPTRANVGNNDVNDPFGGNDGLNQAKITADSPVQIFASGFRNAYDLVLTSQGRIYTWDNGANFGWGGHPANEGGGNATNQWLINEPGSRGPGPGNDPVVNNRDGLHYVGFVTDENQTYYGGHPNPIRANPAGAGLFTHSTSGGGSDGVWRTSVTNNIATTLPVDWPPVPAQFRDTREGDFQNAGVDDLSLFTLSSTTNGMTEYVSGAGGGAMLGDLLAVSWNGNLYRVQTNSEGTINSDADVTVLGEGIGGLPLDVTTQGDGEVFPGTIWVARYSGNGISVFTPSSQVVCGGIDSINLDDDNDGFSNADEIDNGTDPCNASSLPFDLDGDSISDFNDPDDDNDLIPDTEDAFPLDPNNGLTTFPPINYELLNGDPGTGFFGLGFTGLMHDLESDYLSLLDEETNSDTEIIAGGAVGLLTFNPAPAGSALNNADSLHNAFQFGINIQQTSPPFTVSTEVLDANLEGSPGSIGLFLGDGSQSNYISLSLSDTAELRPSSRHRSAKRSPRRKSIRNPRDSSTPLFCAYQSLTRFLCSCSRSLSG